MVTFVLRHGTTTLTIPSLRTHCPIMIRANIEGVSYAKEICRCDVTHLKKELHPGRCSSNGKCPVREKLSALDQKVTCEYGLL